jgi:hypothetical protein
MDREDFAILISSVWFAGAIGTAEWVKALLGILWAAYYLSMLFS